MKLSGRLHRLYNPSVFQGLKKKDKYFEGWYFKLVDPEGKHIWSVIPGVSYSDDSHSFIQLIHANSGLSYYKRFPVEAFTFDVNEFRIQIGPNSFSNKYLTLDIETEDLLLKGELSFIDTQAFPVRLFSPGIMGWYAFVPFMECYHGVVSMQHGLSGKLEINGSTFSFDGGKGYIEKDWGRSMPSDWIWTQSNHFDQKRKASFMLSVARIPWLKGYFPGFLSFLQVDERLYRFASYNGSSVKSLCETEDKVKIELTNKKYMLEVSVSKQDGGMLKAPRHGMMDRDIKECIISSLDLALKNRNGEILFSGTGRYAGLEIVGNMEQYYLNNT